MSRFTLLVPLLVAALLPLTAQAGHGVRSHVLLDTLLANAPGHHLNALTVTYAPGGWTPAHHHDAAAFVYVLAGHVRSQVEGEPARVYGPGEVWFEPPRAHHVICQNASASEPARMLVVSVAATHAALYVPDR